MQEVILVIHLMLSVALVVTVLLQQSEGGALGIGGGPTSMMSGRSAANLLTRMTTILVACFFVTSLILAWLAKRDTESSSVLDGPVPAAIEETMPENSAIPDIPVSK
jgi:preprotein translocase subunit SecG